MSKIVIGKSDGRNVELNLDGLLRGRMLIQANSGKGKSWLLRRLAEQLFGKVQVIIIDPEGEFATLREKFGFVLVGKGGETPADPRSAAMVAHKLLELRASAVCDLFEMRPDARHQWVKLFLDAMVEAPKSLWHPCVVVVDEAHQYAPEKGAGESVASDAMISLSTRGRKRGFAVIAATQRLGKLRKDFASELLNVMIGGTFIDVDRKRAADALGFYGADMHDFFDKVKVLKPGSFFALGPAISDERLLLTVGDVETTHPEAGSAKHAAEAPPAPEEIAKLLPKLADLPKQAEEKAKTEADLRSEIRSLKAQLLTQPKSAPAPIRPNLDEFRKVRAEAQKQINVAVHANKELLRKGGAFTRTLADLAKRAAELFDVAQLPEVVLKPVNEWPRPEIPPDTRPPAAGVVRREAAQKLTGPVTASPSVSNGDIRLRPGAVRMLKVMAMFYPRAVSEGQVAAQAGVKRSGGSFSSYKSNLKVLGYLQEQNGAYAATEAGMAYLGDAPPAPGSTDEVLALWRPKLRPGAQRMLDALIARGGEAMSHEDLAAESGVDVAGGSFSSYLSNLRTADLVVDAGRRMVAANRESLFL